MQKSLIIYHFTRSLVIFPITLHHIGSPAKNLPLFRTLFGRIPFPADFSNHRTVLKPLNSHRDPRQHFAYGSHSLIPEGIAAHNGRCFGETISLDDMKDRKSTR